MQFSRWRAQRQMRAQWRHATELKQTQDCDDEGVSLTGTSGRLSLKSHFRGNSRHDRAATWEQTDNFRVNGRRTIRPIDVFYRVEKRLDPAASGARGRERNEQEMESQNRRLSWPPPKQPLGRHASLFHFLSHFRLPVHRNDVGAAILLPAILGLIGADRPFFSVTDSL